MGDLIKASLAPPHPLPPTPQVAPRRRLKTVALGVMIPLRLRATQRRHSETETEALFLPEVRPVAAFKSGVDQV
jgi:hypothetical protein